MWNEDEIRNLYYTIPTRKSIRKYKTEPLSEEFLKKVQTSISKLKIFFPEEPIAFQILNDAQVKGRIIQKGAFYFAIYAEHGTKS